jgi:hypothetical protein
MYCQMVMINVLDIAHLRSLILGKTDEFPQNTSWRFVSSDQSMLPGSINPPLGYDEQRWYDDLSAPQRGGDFIGVKIGDVNNSAQVNSTIEAESRSGEVLRLSTEDATYRPGEKFRVVFTSKRI